MLPGGGGGNSFSSTILKQLKVLVKLKLSDFKDTLLRHILQVKPVR